MTSDYTAAGVRVVVTPPPGFALGGYVARDGVAAATADELEANIVWLSGPYDSCVVWVALDALAIDQHLRQALARAVARSLAVATEKVLVVASHTHAAPSGWHGTIHPVLPIAHDDALIAALAASVEAASATLHQRRRSVTLHRAETVIDGAGANRHRPDGPHDRSSAVLVCRDAVSGEPVAALFDYACHPTVLGPDNLLWSADWVGAARESVRASLRPDGDPMPVVFLQGAAGDVSPRFVRRDRDRQEVQRLGELVGDAVSAAAEQAEPPESDMDPGVELTRWTITLPTRALGEMLVEPERPAVPGIDDAAAGRLARSWQEGMRAGKALMAAGLPAQIELPIALVRVGPWRWLHLPVELFASLGLRLRAAAPWPIRVVGYTDGYAGYVADRAGHESGQYEALSSLFDADGSEALVQQCLQALTAAATRPTASR